MTRWALVADLGRCVGCQTCTAACKHANATAPGVQWRRVVDFEAGTFPDVARAFVPVGCMHCAEPSCLEVCPSGATWQREDGIVLIDYDICIGCGYCMVACPYRARSRVNRAEPAYGRGRRMRHEEIRADPKMLGVAQKCTFCAERIDAGLAAGLTPGIDEAATPACVAACISGALRFGDLDDPESEVSQLLAGHAHSRMHEELGNGPAIHYLHGPADEAPAGDAPMEAEPVGLAAVAPRLQDCWDRRAAVNFILGGTGTGLLIAAMLAGSGGAVTWGAVLLALALVAGGLFSVWMEIGRPWRFLNVFRHPSTSWMTREALLALPLFALGGLAWLLGVSGLSEPGARLAGLGAAGFALAFVYAQGRILRAARGIPAWRRPEIVALIVLTGLTEGTGLFAALAPLLAAAAGGTATGTMTEAVTGAVPAWLAPALVVLLGTRMAAWRRYRRALGDEGAPTRALAALDSSPAFAVPLQFALVLLAAAALLPLAPALQAVALGLAGLGAMLSGWLFKLGLVTAAAYDQGYALNRFPARGAGPSRPGIRPGWTRA